MTKGSLLLVRRFAAPVEAVFRAWVDPEMMVRWLLPGDVRQATSLRCDARKGGLFCLEGRCDDASSFVISGRYLDLAAPTTLVVTWRYEGPDDALQGADFIVRVGLRSLSPYSTELVLIHKRLLDHLARECVGAEPVGADAAASAFVRPVARRGGGPCPKRRAALPPTQAPLP